MPKGNGFLPLAAYRELRLVSLTAHPHRSESTTLSDRLAASRKRAGHLFLRSVTHIFCATLAKEELEK